MSHMRVSKDLVAAIRVSSWRLFDVRDVTTVHKKIR